jgi:hypothetical protein
MMCDIKKDSAGYTLGPVSDGGLDPRARAAAQARERRPDGYASENWRRILQTYGDLTVSAQRMDGEDVPVYFGTAPETQPEAEDEVVDRHAGNALRHALEKKRAASERPQPADKACPSESVGLDEAASAIACSPRPGEAPMKLFYVEHRETEETAIVRAASAEQAIQFATAYYYALDDYPEDVPGPESWKACPVDDHGAAGALPWDHTATP